jgi:hypothetical protein
MRVVVEDVLLVDEGIRVSEGRQKCCSRKLEVEHCRVCGGCFDPVDHRVVAATHTDHALRRINDFAPAGHHVVGRHRRSIAEPHIVTDLKGVGPAVVSRLWDLGADIADELRRVRRILRVRPNQHAIEGRNRMDGGERVLAMAVEARRRVGRDHEGQGPAVLRRIIGPCWPDQGQDYRRTRGETSTHCCLPGRDWSLARRMLRLCRPAGHRPKPLEAS